MHLSMLVLKNLLNKKFSRVVVYCLVIKVPVVSCLKRQLLYSITAAIVCQELFYFSLSLIPRISTPAQATACIIYHIAFFVVNHFFQVFLMLPLPAGLPRPGPFLHRSFFGDRSYLITTISDCQRFFSFF